MRLVAITAKDEDLAVRLECDPETMRHIGGSRSEPDVRASHKRRIELMEKGEARMYKIVSDGSGQELGTIGIWRIDWKGPRTYEIGWFVLPEHREKGIAAKAARLILSLARNDPKVDTIHAYPSVTNAASNAIARNMGMVNQGEFDNQGFAGVLRCNDWRIDLR